MSSTIPTARAITVPPPSADTLSGPSSGTLSGPQSGSQTPTQTTPAAADPQLKPPSSEHILPGLSSRRSSLGSVKQEGGADSEPVRSRPSSPPRQTAPKVLSRTSSTNSTGGPGRSADGQEHIPMTPLGGNPNGSSSSLSSDAQRPVGAAPGGAPSITEQRRSSATETEHSSALPHQPRDEITELTRGMPGAFEPRLRTEPEAGPRAPAGLLSLHAESVPSPRDVNPRIDLGALAQKLPDDVTGCVAYMLSAMRQSRDDIPALETLAKQQTAVLESRGIRTRDDFVAVLQQVQWRDQGTAMMHGMASASGFNLGSLPVNLKVADLTLAGLMKTMPQLPVAVPALITGAVMGLALSMLDVASGAAAGKTFHDAYFTRPPGEQLANQLPDHLANANPPTKTSLAKDNSAAAGLSYGAARNGAIRVPLMVGLELAGKPEVRAKVDGLVDPLLGLPVGGGGMRIAKNSFDVTAGRAGFQHFLAREDLGDCIAHLQKPGSEQVLSALARFGTHAVNLKQTFPEALADTFASKVGYTSHGILGAGFAGLTAMVASLPATLQKDHGLSETAANITTQSLKFVVLQALYHVWGGALGAVGGPKAPDPAAVSHA
ncbi:hypothetical protein [Roseateles chitinivorans]|uniref:hypothetical protein n=1 Tax=Roseateles chitinivorans TaxID=2917965 RepID=UPI003D6666B8